MAQLKPLLPCDVSNASSGYGSQPSSSTSIATHQMVTYKQPIRIKKEETEEVSKANSVYSFEPKIYNQAFSPVKTEKADTGANVFFSGLNNQVKVK